MKCCDSYNQCIDCPSRPTPVARIKASRARTCEELGICQGHATPCAGCTSIEREATQADIASLNELPASTWDRITFYGVVGIASACTVAMVFGSMGWAYTRWIA